MPCPPPLLLMRADGLEPDMGGESPDDSNSARPCIVGYTKEAMRRGSRAVDMAANEY